jgi:alkanesulfonate monooxygenase SsuD/methylene tetrahydromethanopterin reductase-like flavin-dependent oxidoreductase (luciferase family)
MQFGYFVHYAGPDKSSRQRYRDAHEQIEFLDEVGFAHVWFPEHHFTQLTHAAAPLLSVVDAANRTKRIRLGTSVILSPYHHPLLLAEQIAMADHFTEGRLEVGFARGSYVYEYQRLGIGSEIEAGERQAECLDILLGMWDQDDDFEYHGKYYSFPPTYTLPRPYQEPHPPLWLAARSADTMRFAIERGFGLHVSPLREPMARLVGQMNMLDALVEETGVGQRPPIALQVLTYVAEDRAEVLGAMQEVWRGHVMNYHAHHNAAVIHRGYPPETPLSGDVIAPDELAARLVAGDPETCVAKLRQYAAMGFDEFVVHLDFGLDQERTMRSLRLFAKEVMPHFAQDTVATTRRAPTTRNGSARVRMAASSEVEAATAEAYGLGSDWRRWEVQDWLTHFDKNQTARRKMLVFDFATAPRVKADAAGFVGGSGRLWMISDEGCPECGRPLIALFSRDAEESPSALRAELRAELRTGNWHGSHAPAVRPITSH